MKNSFAFDITALHAYCGHLCNNQELFKSSSGGVTSALSKMIISKGGSVFGVKYSDDYYSAHYCIVTEESQINTIIGSKYIYTGKQIEYNGIIMSVFEAIEKELALGKDVLFFGLGCDVAAVKNYLDNKHIDASRIFLVDIICQGPTLSKVQESYLKNLEHKYSSEVVDFSVRYKKFGWKPPYIHVEFANGKKYEEAFYGSDFGFAFQNYSNKGCYNCQYRGLNRYSDVTIGDYWGLKKDDKEYNRNGVSLMIVRTEKGDQLIQSINPQIFIINNADIIKALTNNPMYYECRKLYKNHENFKNNLNTVGLHKAVMIELGTFKYYMLRIRRRLVHICRLIHII